MERRLARPSAALHLRVCGRSRRRYGSEQPAAESVRVQRQPLSPAGAAAAGNLVQCDSAPARPRQEHQAPAQIAQELQEVYPRALTLTLLTAFLRFALPANVPLCSPLSLVRLYLLSGRL